MGLELPASIEETEALLSKEGYLAPRDLATTLFLSLRMARPLFLEGEAGVGKTEVAKVLASALGRDLVRLQCYEGLDISSAVYEWNYARQMIAIRAAEAGNADSGSLDSNALARDVFSAEFLVSRPLLNALEDHENGAPVLLIDELDRTDEPFEAFLLELLSEFQVTIPELGTIKASQPPLVILTSNRTREVHDALKRRCLYFWVDYPDLERELAIVHTRLPNIDKHLARQVVGVVQALRQLDLYKSPGIAETLDWAEALIHLDKLEVDMTTLDNTLGTLLKYQDDIARVQGSEAARVLEQVKSELMQG